MAIQLRYFSLSVKLKEFSVEKSLYLIVFILNENTFGTLAYFLHNSNISEKITINLCYLTHILGENA